MKILHLSTRASGGGAAIIAKQLNDGLNSAGEQSFILNQENNFYSSIKAKADKLITKIFLPAENRPYYTGIFSSLDWKKIKEIQPDIINLHWIGKSFVSLNDLAKFDCPVVWTLHDSWALNGASFFSNPDESWKNGYKHKFFNLDYFIWKKKKKIYPKIKNLNIVAPSNWLSDRAKASLLLKNFPITTINNGIDLNLFRPHDKKSAREKLSLPPDKKIILYGADFTDPEKGFKCLCEAIKNLDAKKYFLVLFGSAQKIENLPISFTSLGLVKRENLPLIYSAADCFAAPYLEDNFPTTVLEAMACEVPVVGFRAGGIPEIIDHEVNGYLAEKNSAEDLARGLLYILEGDERRKLIGTAARRKIQENFTLKKQADKYLELYKKILGENIKTGFSSTRE